MTGSLNMNGNQIIRLKEPVSSSDASTKGYTDRMIDNIQKIDTTLFIKKNGSVPMAADLDMDNHKIVDLKDPVNDTDASNKNILMKNYYNHIFYQLQFLMHSNIYLMLMKVPLKVI